MASNVAGMLFFPYYRQLMDILETDTNLRKTAKGIFTQMGYSAGGAALGGVFAGPPGALLGGIVGSVYGYSQVENYDTLLNVLRNLTDEDKQNLTNKVQELVGSQGIEALTSFVASQVNREIFINVVKEFAKASTKGG